MTITIAGAGIGGLALALALHRTGQSAQLLEGADQPTPGQGGAFLNLAPNGVKALATIGLADAVTGAGFPTTGIAFHNAAGRRVGWLDATGQAVQYGASNMMIRRADLHQLLTDAVTAAGIPIHYGHRVGKVTEYPEQANVQLSSGVDCPAEYLIGADGVHSPTRTHVLGEPRQPDYLGLLDLAGFAPTAPSGAEPGPQRMIFGRRAFFAYVVTPDRQTWWFSNIPLPGRPDRDHLRDRSPAQWRAELMALHRDDPAEIAQILRHTEPPLGPWPLTDLPFLSRWHTDRVCLLGDAAHATSPSAGQGAALAIEDAIELARAIAVHGPGPAAFAAFERHRRPRVEALIQTARRNGSHKAPGPVGRVLRDLLLPVFLRMGGKETAAAYGHDTAPLPAPRPKDAQAPHE